MKLDYEALQKLLAVAQGFLALNSIMSMAEAVVFLYLAGQADGTPAPAVTEVSVRLGLELPRTSRILNILEGDGWVERVRDPADSRIRRCIVTAEGHAVLANIAALIKPHAVI